MKKPSPPDAKQLRALARGPTSADWEAAARLDRVDRVAAGDGPPIYSPASVGPRGERPPTEGPPKPEYAPGDELWYLECQCESPAHSVRVRLADDGDVVLETHLVRWRPLWQRLALAVRYVLNMTPPHGPYDVTILRLKDYDVLRTLLDRSEAIRAERGAP